MQGFVSSRQCARLALVSLGIVFAACSILDPYGPRWMGVGWGGLTLAAALWLSMGESMLAVAADCPADLAQRR